MIRLAKTLYKVYPLNKNLQRTNSTHQCYTPQADFKGPCPPPAMGQRAMPLSLIHI